jgi:hypothetical protein
MAMDGIHLSERKVVLLLSSLVVLLASIAFAVNLYIYKYPGNNYFPAKSLHIIPILLLVYVGLYVQYGRNSRAFRYLSEIARFYLILAIIAFATSAIQFTPFVPIDKYIVSFEKSMHFDLIQLLVWVRSEPFLQIILSLAYDSLTYQMALFPLIAIAIKRYDVLNEYYILLLITLLIGFTFYYFFPTTAPASIFDRHYFNESQIATGLKFIQIHQHLKPSTIDGGLIALPSFHMIWAWLCLYLIRNWTILFVIFLPINILIILSCVLLGWHYPTDLFASLLLLLFAHGICIMHRSATKRGKAGCEDHTSIQQVSVLDHTIF